MSFSSLKYAFRKWTNKFFFAVLLPMVETNAYIISRRLREGHEKKQSKRWKEGHRDFRDSLAIALMAIDRPQQSAAAQKPLKRRRSSSDQVNLEQVQSKNGRASCRARVCTYV